MFYASHGGQCCGILHAFGFDDEDGTSLDRIIGNHDRMSNRVLEVILIDDQIAKHEPDLIEHGFVKVARWLNGNSGNFCNSYYRYRPWHGSGSIEFYGLHPGAIRAALERNEEVPPARQELRVVSTEFYVIRRHKGKCGPFVSELEAAEMYPNVRQIQRREILSNGESRWSEPEVRL